MPFQGATAPTRDTQGVASLALGYVLHWAFSPSLLNPKLQQIIAESFSRDEATEKTDAGRVAPIRVSVWCLNPEIGCTSAIKMKVLGLSFCIALGLHYL